LICPGKTPCGCPRPAPLSTWDTNYQFISPFPPNAAFEQFLAACPKRKELEAMLAQAASDRSGEAGALSRPAADWLRESLPSPGAGV
jgi:hypothetical protein